MATYPPNNSPLYGAPWMRNQRDRLRSNYKGLYGTGTSPATYATADADALRGANTRVGVQNPMNDPVFSRRRLRAMSNVTRGASAAGDTFQRQTGLGAGTAGGAAQSSLLKALGAANAQGVGDEMYNSERNYLTGLESGNADRNVGVLNNLAALEAQANSLRQNESQYARSLEEEQRQYDETNGLNDPETPEDDFITGPTRGPITRHSAAFSPWLSRYGR